MINIKTRQEIQFMRDGGRHLAKIMAELIKTIRPGISTGEIDKLAEKLIFESGGKPSFKGYEDASGRKFPATICASLNAEVVHGIPSFRTILKEGDILKIDIGMQYKGFHTDMARSIAVGDCDKQVYELIKIVEKSFWQGIKNLKAGKLLSDYSKAVQAYVEENKFSVVRNLVGHGIGRDVHEDPQIPNYYSKKYKNERLIPGMTLALEPMINAGGFETVLGHDGWVFMTLDSSLSAHYENTVLITEKGVKILTTA